MSTRRVGQRVLQMIGRFVPLLLLVVLGIIEVAPMLYLAVSSVRPEAEFTTQPLWSLPSVPQWDNYAAAWTNMATYLRNSVLVAVPSLTLIVTLSLTAAFALQVMRWRGQDAIIFFFLAGIMIPLQMILLPLFTVFLKAHLLNSLLSLIISYTVTGLPISIFLMVGYYKSISREIIEAAVLDGASIFQIFLRVAVPMMGNAIVTIVVIEFFFIWNDLMFPLTFISDDRLRPVPTGLLNFATQYGQLWGPTFASVCMVTLPTLAIYLFLNQRVIKGLAAGSLKG